MVFIIWFVLLAWVQKPLVYASDSQATINSVFVIGDLHGDAYCGHHWVKQTKLIANLGSLPYKATDVIWNYNTNNATKSIIEASKHWEWNDPTTGLVFLGDYIDKGPTSMATLTLVKRLTERFPQYVTALLGNHEMELLLDRDTTGTRKWGDDGALYFQMGYSATHPRDYLDYMPSELHNASLDGWVMQALYNASIEVYARNMEHSIRMAPLSNPQSAIRLLDHLSAEEQQKVSDRLALYQDHYLNSFKSDTDLGKWLETRPLVHVAPQIQTLFVHGGLRNHPYIHDLLKSGSVADIANINQVLANHISPDKLAKFMTEQMEGIVLYDMLVFRGNHGPTGCQELKATLATLHKTNQTTRPIKRLAVGHTPYDDIQINCEGQFLALDSALGRWIRALGNDYCPGDQIYASKDSKYKCHKIETTCQGQIVRLYTGDKLEVLNASGKIIKDHSLATSFSDEL